MSNKSGVSSQAVTLPNGGGAIQSIGESFSPDLFTGTGNFSVPLVLPPGRNGFHAELSLAYSTGVGNGAFGLGWDLSVPTISRKTTRGVPRYRDDAGDASERDVFLFSGADDLVPVSEAEAGVTRFSPRTEGWFARIERIRDASSDFWRVRGREGLVHLYGTPESLGDDPAVIADPAERRNAFCWRLSLTMDPYGNRIEYLYLRDSGTTGPHRWDQLYLQRVRYADFEEDGQTRFLISVEFEYEERPDAFSSYRSGFEIRTRLRCRRIQVRTHPSDDLLLRTYELQYVDDRVRAGELSEASLPRNSASLLSTIQVVGHDGDRRQKMSPLEFGYTQFDPGRRRFQSVRAVNGLMPPKSLADPDFEMVDLFGNGLPDIVQMNGVAQFWRNLGGGLFDTPRTMAEVPAGVRLADSGVQFADMNGNGRADLLVLSLGGYFPLSFQGRWSRQGFVRWERIPSFDPSSPDLRLFDVDGDGVVDALRTGTEFELFLNDPARGWTGIETRPREPLDEFPNLSFADHGVKLGDMSGDGLQDFIRLHAGGVEYWPYLGHGRWARRIQMANSPRFPEATFDPQRILLGDADGDGLDDLVLIEQGRITVWINQSGNRWSDPVVIDGTPPFSGADAVRFADVLGTGIQGVLWTADQLSPGEDACRFLDFTGAVKPYVLDRMDNHRGAVTRVTYASSTDFYRTDFGKPQTRWKTPLPFPVPVVAKVEVFDHFSQGKLSTEFRYHHGYWDGAEREFRGFGMVEQLDAKTVEGSDSGNPALTKTWFHQGAVGDEFAERKEADFSGEYWPEDPPALSRFNRTGQAFESLRGRARADALRSLRGSVLRTEV
jgi:hypothetical protein